MTKQKPERRLIGLMNAYVDGVSGGDIWFIEVVKRLDNFQKTIITTSSGADACRERNLKDCKYRRTEPPIKLPLIADYVIRTVIASFWLAACEAEVVYSSSDFFPDVVPALILKVRRPGTLWIQKIYHLVPAKRFPAWLLQKLSHLLIRAKADLVVVDNRMLAEKLIESGFDRGNVRVARPGIDFPATRMLTTWDTPIKEGAVYVGRVHHAKGIEELIEIWRMVTSVLPEMRLTMIGSADSNYLDKAMKLVKARGLGHNVIFLGYVRDEAVTEAIIKSRVFVTASVEEGYGIALLEALSLGTPVVCWDIPAFREAFGELVTLTPIGDRSAFCENITKLLSDDDYHRSVTEMVDENFEHFSWEMSAKQELSLLEEKYETSHVNKFRSRRC